MIAKGTTKIDIICHGEKKVQRVYKGTTKIFEYLPLGYKECKYLESTGTQYIDSNIKATENTKLELSFSIDTVEQGVSYRIFGARNSSNNKAFVVGKQSSTNSTIFAQFDTITPVNVKNIRPSVNTITKITLSKDGFYVNNQLSRTFEGYNDFTTSNNILLFAVNSGGTVSTTTQNLRIYYTKLWEDGELILNLIPCLDDNDVPCMYDTVSKTTLYNVGTGTFNYELL